MSADRQLWERFHEVVNMPSPELRSFLLTEASTEEASSAEMPPLGERVLKILAKRFGDLTRDDEAAMRLTVNAIDRLHAAQPPDKGADDTWRHALMRLGHDPLRER
ncbi:DUF3140 domain-containing protein [Rhizomonospora bruguierae]|uniref:DUF3140 domain-containing protein n=1 Tax=Rhizomonospora bruguierae TaxID=1581705 RepID=UPI001BCDD5DC|nr:DUF3140 domain-containing protein [Micromonospora sp. NBRC 107566]